ncbi:hypothetical protein FXB41_36175 [Bradyrhizobium canariense]|uniref:hypothetical protein n=1 Tax=Bradyrhizobium TaxID=374 RepID=UPI001CA55680|nr:hypothetical protein [Bradyrhizobium canariense]MBW5440004.1 hypothetical protein [Bradyrhizobium canariense]
MSARNRERPGLGSIDLVLEISERLRLPVSSFASEGQGFGLRCNSDERGDIGIVFKAGLEAMPYNCPGTFQRRDASGKYAFRRLNNDLASSNDLGLIPTHGDPGLTN